MRIRPQPRFRGALLVTHAGLAVAVTATLAAVDAALPVRLVLIVAALLPLVATLPGLVRMRIQALRWLAFALVIYAGLGSVEVMATGTLAAGALLLFALLELGLVMAVSRRLALLSRDAREES